MPNAMCLGFRIYPLTSNLTLALGRMISCTKLVLNQYLGTRRSNVPIWYLDVGPGLWVLFSFQNQVASSMLSISPVPSSLTNGQQNSGIKTELQLVVK